MSTPPQPWFSIADLYRQTAASPQVIRVVSEDADRVHHALEAFEGLLAVARAADTGGLPDLFVALENLSAAHPGWREWA